MAASTRARVGSLTRGLSLSTRDTVPAPTPACAATSAMVTTTPLSRASPWNRFQISWRERTSRLTKCQWKRFPRAGPTPMRSSVWCRSDEDPLVGPPGGDQRFDPEAPLRDRLHQVVHEPLELAEVAALEGAVAEGGVLADDRVARVPVAAGLGVEPVDVAGAVLHLLYHPRLGGVGVVAGVAQQQHGGLGADLPAPALPELLEGMAVVAVAVDPDDVGLGVDPVDRLPDVLDALEHAGHLVDAVDEHERPHLGELVADGVDEVQREAGEGRHRPRDVGDDEDLGLGRPGVAELRIDRHAAGRQRVPHGRAEVERALAAVAPLAGQAYRQLAGERVDRLAQRGHLLAASVHEVDVLGQGLAERAGHGLDAAVGHQAPSDLGLDLLAEVVDPGLVLVALEPLLERGERLRRLVPGLLHEAVEDAVEVEVAQRAVEVVGAADGAPGLHARVASHGLAGSGPVAGP